MDDRATILGWVWTNNRMSSRGVKKYPTRVKCATLSWHALMAALEGKKETSTE